MHRAPLGGYDCVKVTTPTDTSEPRPPNRRSNRTTVIAIAIMLVLWLLVVINRDWIRVRWWGHQLQTAKTAADRTYYLQLLASRKRHSLPVARELLADDDAGVRSYAVALLNVMDGDDARGMLNAACADPDETVRRNAIIGLSLRSEPAVVARMSGLTDYPDECTALLAVSRLVSIGTPEALAALARLADRHPNPAVRAQAIESLGQWDGADAVGPLIECLDDDAVFTGMTESQRSALAALDAVGMGAMGDMGTNGAAGSADLDMKKRTADLIASNHLTNGQRAAIALRRITDQSFGYVEAAPADRAAIIAKWRAWHEHTD